jgi:hypothetical protein
MQSIAVVVQIFSAHGLYNIEISSQEMPVTSLCEGAEKPIALPPTAATTSFHSLIAGCCLIAANRPARLHDVRTASRELRVRKRFLLYLSKP